VCRVIKVGGLLGVSAQIGFSAIVDVIFGLVLYYTPHVADRAAVFQYVFPSARFVECQRYRILRRALSF
jgi:hypothetical protein